MPAASPTADQHTQALALAIDALHRYQAQPNMARFNAASQQLNTALTLALELVGAEHTSGPALVAQLRDQYGAQG
ncbi:hypothetical protein [Mycobacterium avium]|uniref:hypothetical protein n=1 Tax=Mycobacterium avium TaxID=1764 RepID=UPI001CC94D37|nr:hypothetical protein [Mycobacterium avium]MBZ4575434.1 hypothetical protein [Mycobacterium avium subsp. hominissuis]